MAQKEREEGGNMVGGGGGWEKNRQSEGGRARKINGYRMKRGLGTVLVGVGEWKRLGLGWGGGNGNIATVYTRRQR